MADAPPKAGLLVARHAQAALFESRNRKRVGEGEFAARGRFKEDLMRYAAVFVLVPSSLAYTLENVKSARQICFLGVMGNGLISRLEILPKTWAEN